MPGGHGTHEQMLKESLKNHELTEEQLNTAVADILQFILDAYRNKLPNAEIDREKCSELSGELAAQCAVLLKNEDILPLKKDTKIAVIGDFAKHPRYQGSGSSHINASKTICAIETLKEKEACFLFAKGFDADTVNPDKELIQEAVKIAEASEAAVIFAGLPDAFESEGFDREHLDLPENQNALIEAICKVQKNVIVVLHGGSPMLLPWEDQVKGILCMYLGGQEVGRAAVELLYGEKNPSGKLAETWPLRLEDTPSYLNFPGVDGIVNYREDIFIGYRYYDKKKMKVQYPFGHGLSYTSFSYSDLKTDKITITDKETLHVSCKIKNTGTCAGKEIVQLYVKDVESSVERPVRELKGFAKIYLNPGEEKEVEFTLDKRSFSYYETLISDWFVESGEFVIEIGASSRDIRLSQSIQVEGTGELPYHYTENSLLCSLQRTNKGQKMLKRILSAMTSNTQQDFTQMESLGDGADKMKWKILMEMPLGTIAGLGIMSDSELEILLNNLNSSDCSSGE